MKQAALLALISSTFASAHSVLDFGAVTSPLEIDTPTSFANADAFLKTI